MWALSGRKMRKIWCFYYVIKQKKLGGGILIKESCFNFVSCYCEKNGFIFSIFVMEIRKESSVFVNVKIMFRK